MSVTVTSLNRTGKVSLIKPVQKHRKRNRLKKSVAFEEGKEEGGSRRDSVIYRGDNWVKEVGVRVLRGTYERGKGRERVE